MQCSFVCDLLLSTDRKFLVIEKCVCIPPMLPWGLDLHRGLLRKPVRAQLLPEAHRNILDFREHAFHANVLDAAMNPSVNLGNSARFGVDPGGPRQLEQILTAAYRQGSN